MTIVRNVRAPAATVFDAVADPRQFAKAIDGVTKLEFLTPSTWGVGTRFRQSRVQNGKETTMDFELTEYVKPSRVRIVNETHGTVWDSVFTVAPDGPGTTLTLRMTTRGGRWLQRLLMPIVCLLIKKIVAKDIDAVKAFCERGSH